MAERSRYVGVRRRGKRWYWQATVRIDGLRHDPCGYADTAQQANVDRQAAIGRLRAGDYTAVNKLTVGEWIEEWRQNRQIEVTTKSSHYYLARRIHTRTAEDGTVVVRGIAHLPLHGERRIRASHVLALYADLHERGKVRGGGYAPASIQSLHQFLKTAFGAARAEGVMDHDPMATIPSPFTDEEVEQRTWTAVEAARFLALVAEHRLRAMFVLGMVAGLRRGEVAGLRVEDLHLDEGYIHCVWQRAVVPPHDGRPREVVLKRLKWKKGRRAIEGKYLAIGDGTMQVLRRHLHALRVERMASPYWEESGYVFVDQRGQPLDPNVITMTHHRLCEEADVPVIRFHDLRHTCGTLLHELGFDLEAIKERLDHTDFKMTQRYVHTSAEAMVARQRPAADAIEGALGL